jgi:hypothetical protein
LALARDISDAETVESPSDHVPSEPLFAAADTLSSRETLASDRDAAEVVEVVEALPELLITELVTPLVPEAFVDLGEAIAMEVAADPKRAAMAVPASK